MQAPAFAPQLAIDKKWPPLDDSAAALSLMSGNPGKGRSAQDCVEHGVSPAGIEF